VNAVRRHVGNATVAVLIVVPGKEGLTVRTCIFDGSKALGKVGSVFERFELCLGIRVVVRGVGPAMAPGDVQVDQQAGHRFGAHARASVSVQTERTRRDFLALGGILNQTGAQLLPLYDAHRAFVLGSRVLHDDETPIGLLDPGGGKTKKAYMWAYARGALEDMPGVVYDFCEGRGGKYPHELLKGWTGTLVVDAYSGYDATLSLEGRKTGVIHRVSPMETRAIDKRPMPVPMSMREREAWVFIPVD
jgi:hypothetical protein